jgi:hypothetical protein
VTDRGDRPGRADLHIHTIASDGTADVVSIVERAAARDDLDVIAITDHERIDAAVAGRAIAVDRGLAVEVIVGEEVTTLGGHLLALYIERPIRPYRTLRTTIADVHDAGGIAVPAHPLVPYPLCAQGWVLLSGSGVDRGMLDRALAAVGAERLLWGCDITLETGLAKWWALEVMAPGDDALTAIRWRNAAGIFPAGSLPGVPSPAGVR